MHASRDDALHGPDLLAQLGLAALLGIGLAFLQQPYRLGYDETWHVLFAEMQPFGGFLAEVRTDAHPPLSYLLLRPLTEAGAPPLAARSLSILAAALTPFAVFVAARSLRLRRGVAHLLSLLLATSLLHVTLGIVVRSYALAHLGTWLWIGIWVRLLEEPPAIPRWQRWIAIVVAVAAVAMLWAAALPGIAALAATGCLLLVDPVLRARSRILAARRSFRVDLLLAAAGIAALAILWSLMRPGALFLHLEEWVLQPGEPWHQFLARGLSGTARALLGAPELPAAIAVPLLPALLIAGWIAARATRARRGIALLALLLAGSLALLGFVRLHPFGGAERQMSILLAPVLLLAGILLDLAAGWLQRRWLRFAAGALILLLAAVHTGRMLAAGHLLDDLHPQDPRVAALEALRPRLQPDDALWVHGFSRVPFYGASRAEGAWVRRPLVEAAGQRLLHYRTQFAGAPRELYFDRRWLAPAEPEPEWLAELAALTGAGHGLWVLCLEHHPRAQSAGAARMARWHAAAAAAQLRVADAVALPHGEAIRLVRP